jgi:glycosyltransferase involved in cell wall biosynthesis
LDALSYGTPVLASDIPENLAVVRNVGFTFSNKDVADLAEKMAYLEARPRLIESFRDLGRRHVEENYNWERLVHRVEAVYRETIDLYSTDEFESLFKRWVLKFMRGKRA